jgi:hypothetical protein
MVVAHELNALRYVQAGFSRLQLSSLLLVSDRKFEAHGRTWGRYEYRVPGQWQGRWRRLRVIGDKKGGASTRRLQRSPELLEGLRATVRVPLRIVHVTRSPFDNIAAIHLMKRGRRSDATLEDAVDFYFELAEATGGLEARVPAEEWLELSTTTSSPRRGRLSPRCAASWGWTRSRPTSRAVRNSCTRDPAERERRPRGPPDWSIRSGGARASIPSLRATPRKNALTRMSVPDRTRPPGRSVSAG